MAAAEVVCMKLLTLLVCFENRYNRFLLNYTPNIASNIPTINERLAYYNLRFDTFSRIDWPKCTAQIKMFNEMKRDSRQKSSAEM